MKKINLFVIGMSVVLLSSCAGINMTNYTNNDVAETSVVLSQNNYRIIGTVSGEATQTYVFGIGGASKRALTANSRAEMYKNADLKDGQAIINVATTYSTKVVLLYMKRIATTTGYVVEFTDSRGSAVLSTQTQSTNVPQQTVVVTENEIIEREQDPIVLSQHDKNRDGKL